jgi:hypothetical protein
MKKDKVLNFPEVHLEDSLVGKSYWEVLCQ